MLYNEILRFLFGKLVMNSIKTIIENSKANVEKSNKFLYDIKR